MSITGLVQEVNNRGRGAGSNIMVNGEKYGCFDPVKAGIDQVAVGDEVTFDTSVNGTYTNIAGTLSKTGVTGTPVAAPPKAGGGGGGYKSGGRSSAKVFPIPTLDGQRSIIRQNSLTHATAIYLATEADKADDAIMIADRVIEIARKFEHFSAGDDIAEAADAAMKELGQQQQ